MITVTGSLAFDYIMDFPGSFGDHIMPDKIHQINLSFLVNDLKKQKGGTAGNIAYNLALLKTPVSIVGATGNDFAEYSKFLQQVGVDISNIKIVDNESSSSAFIMTDKNDNQITGFYPGAMNQNSTLSINEVSDFVVISPNSPDAMIKFTKECQEKNIKFMLDPGMQLPALNPEDLKNMINGAEILIGNDYEIELLMSKLKYQMSNLLEYTKVVITTMGNQGSVIQTKDQKIEVKAGKPLEVLDPTGAGDAYRAGFLAGYLKDLDLKICGQMGSVASCYAVEKYGTTSHSFTVQEFCERYLQNFGEKLRLP